MWSFGHTSKALFVVLENGGGCIGGDCSPCLTWCDTDVGMSHNGGGDEANAPRCDLEDQFQIVQDKVATFFGIKVTQGGNQAHP